MAELRRTAFIQDLMRTTLDTSEVQRQAKLNAADADLNGDGSIDSPEELAKLWPALDALDTDGKHTSIDDDPNSRAGTALAALRNLAEPVAKPSPYRDIVLARTFPQGVVKGAAL